MIVREASANGHSGNGIKVRQEPIIRTYRGYRPEAAEDAYRIDAAKAKAFGYVPVSHRWTHDWEGHALTVAFAHAEQRTPLADEGAPTDESRDGEGTLEAEAEAEAPLQPTPKVVAGPTPVMAAQPAPVMAAGPAPVMATQPTPDAAKEAEEPAPQAAPAASSVPAGRSARLTVEVLDLHCAGEPLRMIRSGFPDVPDLPVLERRRWVARNADHVRRAIVNEPRGHRDMYGAILLPPHTPAADVCLLFMHNEGYSTMCGHGVIAVTTALIEEGLYPATTPSTTIRYEVPAGIVVAEASTVGLEQGAAVESVRFTNVPSYLSARDLPIAPDGVELHGQAAESGFLAVDLAFGGAYYGIVDAAEIGLRVVPEQAAELRRAGAAITAVLRRDHTPAHPTDPDLGFVYGTIIVDRDPQTSPDGRARDATLRNVTIFADAELDRSPCGSGTSALLASMHGRGWAGIGYEFVNAGITGEAFRGRIEGETMLGDEPAIVTSIEGRAYVTGYAMLVVDERDPLGEGFLLS
jgi:proline racemase